MNTHQSTFFRAIGIFLGLTVIVLGAGAIGMMFLGSSNTTTQTATVGEGQTNMMPGYATSVAPTVGKDISNPSAISSSSAIGIMPFPQPGQTSVNANRQFITTAFLTVTVDDLRKRTNEFSQKAKDLGGFASSSSINALDDGSEQAAISLRVPTDKVDAMLQTIRSTALHIVNEQTNKDDTTDQLVDLDARLKSLRQTDDQYAEILKQATNVDDILKITQSRTDTRQQIEQLSAQKQNLESQVAFSTVSVSMSTETGLPAKPTWRPAQQAKLAWQAFIRGVEGTVNILIVGILATLPLIALWLILIWIVAKLGWALITWLRKRIFNT
jgi:hypothetical protein